MVDVGRTPATKAGPGELIGRRWARRQREQRPIDLPVEAGQRSEEVVTELAALPHVREQRVAVCGVLGTLLEEGLPTLGVRCVTAPTSG